MKGETPSIPLTFVIIILSLIFTQLSLAQGKIKFDMEKFWAPIPDEGVDAMTPQEIETANQNLEDAVEPILDMFGFLSGGGLYNTAKMHGILGFDIGVKLTAMIVSDDQQPPIPIDDADLQNGPLGEENIIPIPMLHAGVGLFDNFEVIGRFFTFPMGEGTAEGNITLIGIGAKYGLLQNLALPKIAIVASYHYLTVPESFDFGNINNTSAALIASYKIPLVTLYGGIGIDYTKLKIDFDLLPEPLKFNKTNYRGNIGLKLSPIPIFYINLDYNFLDVQGFSAGAGINIR